MEGKGDVEAEELLPLWLLRHEAGNPAAWAYVRQVALQSGDQRQAVSRLCDELLSRTEQGQEGQAWRRMAADLWQELREGSDVGA